MATIASLLRDRVSLQVNSVDRIFLAGLRAVILRPNTSSTWSGRPSVSWSVIIRSNHSRRLVVVVYSVPLGGDARAVNDYRLIAVD